jgi:hypothetical protein
MNKSSLRRLGNLLREGKAAFWQHAMIQRFGKLRSPGVMEVVKDAGSQLCPVMNRHDEPRISVF